MTNQNYLWAKILVKQLVHLGVEHVVLCAGSRSTPLTLAFTENEDVNCISQIDERSGAFFALGIAKYKQKPAVVVSTSGTAGANFYPAIIEAKASSIPLIVITADRPHELRISGANQTTDQVKIFQDHVNWSVDSLPPFRDENDKINLKLQRYMIQLGAQLVEKSNWPRPGPVHLNFPFRKPLQPKSSEIGETQDLVNELKLVEVTYGHVSPSIKQVERFYNLVNDSKLTLIIAGPNASNECSYHFLQQFQQQSQSLILMDPLSGYRYKHEKQGDNYLTSYDIFLLQERDNLPIPDLVIQIGDMPISKNLSTWLDEIDTEWIMISAYTHSRDANLQSRMLFRVEPEELFKHLHQIREIEANSQSLQKWIDIDQKYKKSILNCVKSKMGFEPNILNTIFSKIDSRSLFIANSLLPRHLDEYVFNSSADLTIFSSRGVSGIDGTLSTSLGIAYTSREPSLLITGDLAFYHDMNGLMAMMRYNINLHIIIINNSGGAIFDRLPIKDFDPPFSEYFFTLHSLNFDKISQQFDIKYLDLDTTREEYNEKLLVKKLEKLFANSKGILEIKTDGKNLEKIRQEILNEVKQDN